MKKKVYGKILALTLAASIVSVPVFAEESADGQQVEVSRQNEEENSEENAEKSTEKKERRNCRRKKGGRVKNKSKDGHKFQSPHRNRDNRSCAAGGRPAPPASGSFPGQACRL